MSTSYDARAEQLRRELGVTERRKGARHHGSERLGTAGELRALIRALCITREQFAKRFRIPRGTLNWWVQRPTSEVIYCSNEVYKTLKTPIDRARELKLLDEDPTPRTLKPRYGVEGAPPPGTLVKWRCTQCGKNFRRKVLEKAEDNNMVHVSLDGRCGPVVPEDTRLKKPEGVPS